MPAKAYDAYIEQGATWQLSVQCLQSLSPRTPFNLSVYTGAAVIRASAQSEEAIATPTVTISDPTNGIVTVSLTDEETAAIPAGGLTYDKVTSYTWELDLFCAADGTVIRLLQGNVSVSPGGKVQ